LGKEGSTPFYIGKPLRVEAREGGEGVEK